MNSARRNFSVAACALAVSCADARAKPTFPEEAGHQVFIEEQALLGLNARGDALAAELFDVEGRPPKLSLLVFDRDAAPTKTLLVAPDAVAQAAADRLRASGAQLLPLLASAVAAVWPEAGARAAEEAFFPAAPASPDPAMHRWTLPGAGLLPLSLRLAAPSSGPPALLLVVSEAPAGVPDADEVELTRMPQVGDQVSPLLWIAGRTLWLEAGSVLAKPNAPLHRTVGLRRGSLARGEATLHNQHGLADYAAGKLDAARREFDRALLADGRFVDALYNAASVAALEDRADDAVALLRRAAAEDPRRVQVLGRDDDDLKTLRQRPDVREILGLVRLPPGE